MGNERGDIYRRRISTKKEKRERERKKRQMSQVIDTDEYLFKQRNNEPEKRKRKK